jgi:hypothetical protein
MGRARSVAVVAVVAALIALSLMPAASAAPSRANGVRATSGRSIAARSAVEFGRWNDFYWGGPGSVASPRRIRFATEGAVVFTLTDVFCTGDRFDVYDGVELLGHTTRPASTNCNADWRGSPNKALVDPNFSHARYALAAGSHAIQIVATRSPWGGGGGSYRIDPLTKAMCKGGGWQLYGGSAPQFANQGACVALVEAGRPV